MLKCQVVLLLDTLWTPVLFSLSVSFVSHLLEMDVDAVRMEGMAATDVDSYSRFLEVWSYKVVVAMVTDILNEDFDTREHLHSLVYVSFEAVTI